MSLWAYEICIQTLETLKNRTKMFTIITALPHALPVTPQLAQLPANPFFHYLLILQHNNNIFSLKLLQTDKWNFHKAQTGSVSIFGGVIFCATHPWMEGNTTFLAKPLHFTNFFLCILHITLNQTRVWRQQIITRILKQKNFDNSIIIQIPITCNYVFCLHYAT